MIRETVPDDFPRLLHITEHTGFFKPIEVQALGEVLDDWLATNKADGHLCKTFEKDKQILGFVYYAPAPMTDRTWHLWWIVVSKDQQGAGIGRQLLDFVEADIRKHKGRVLFIETGSVLKYEPTRRFYRKNHYDEHAVLRDFYADGDSMVIFRKSLS